MANHERAGNGNYRNNQDTSRPIDYEDGSRNKVWDKIGYVYDFSTGGRRGEGLMDTEDTFGVVVNYDNGELPRTVRYVFFHGGGSIVRFETDDKTKETTGVYYNEDDSSKLTSRFIERPMTIGSRSDRLGGGKLMAVMELEAVTQDGGALYPVSQEVVGKKNPLIYAQELATEITEQNNKTNY